ncbi:MAG: YjjG family noncanonical pyrimidine nucleotidase [Trueperaceae bacterium]
MRYSWLFFDADGTLFDFDLAEKLALTEVIETLGQPLSNRAYQNYQSINKALWLAFERGEITQAEIKLQRFERWLETLNISVNAEEVSQHYVQTLSQQGPLLEHALEVVKTLSQHYKILLLTNGLKEVQRPRLEASSLHPYIQKIVVSGEIGFAKPDPRIFETAFRESGQPHKQTVLMIGDSFSADISGGHAYGLDTCWYAPTGERSDLPTYTIHDLRQLLNLLAT